MCIDLSEQMLKTERVHQDFLQPERTAPETDYAYKGVPTNL